MIRRSFRIGLMLGLLAGVAVAVVKTLQSRRPAEPPATDWPPIAEPSPRVPPAEADVVVAPGPDPQPARGDGEPQAPPPLAPPTVETHEGPEAEAHAADADRQPDTAAPDWAPAGTASPPTTDEAAETTAATPAGGPGPPAAAPAPAAPARPARKATKKAAKKAAKTAAAAAPWVGPEGKGCPGSHPVKAKLASRIFHLPGMLNYERTTPDRCYVDAAAAEADGLRAAKR